MADKPSGSQGENQNDKQNDKSNYSLQEVLDAVLQSDDDFWSDGSTIDGEDEERDVLDGHVDVPLTFVSDPCFRDSLLIHDVSIIFSLYTYSYIYILVVVLQYSCHMPLLL